MAKRRWRLNTTNWPHKVPSLRQGAASFFARPARVANRPPASKYDNAGKDTGVVTAPLHDRKWFSGEANDPADEVEAVDCSPGSAENRRQPETEFAQSWRGERNPASVQLPVDWPKIGQRLQGQKRLSI